MFQFCSVTLLLLLDSMEILVPVSCALCSKSQNDFIKQQERACHACTHAKTNTQEKTQDFCFTASGSVAM